MLGMSVFIRHSSILENKAKCQNYRNNFDITYRSAYVAKPSLKLECGPMPNVMVALPNIGGAFCSTPQSSADAHY